MNSKFTGLSFEEIGEAMRPENLRGEAFRLSREERDHVACHALDSIQRLAQRLDHRISTKIYAECSDAARQVAALSNLLGDIGWERESPEVDAFQGGITSWPLGELFPVAQLGPWLEEWQRQDDEALVQAETLFKGRGPEDGGRVINDAQIKLGTGAILLARIEKWMASHDN
jgi:hypothetical protein